MTAVAATDPTTSSLAREVAHARGLPIPLRITSITVPTAADAHDYGPVGWSRHDDEHDGPTWYVRIPVELHTDEPAAAVPPMGIAVCHELVRDETIADVVLALTCEADHDERKWDVDYITIRGCTRVVEIARKTFDRSTGMWVTESTETTSRPLDVAKVDDALHQWAARERKHSRRDPLALELQQSAVEIVETDALYDAEVTL